MRTTQPETETYFSVTDPFEFSHITGDDKSNNTENYSGISIYDGGGAKLSSEAIIASKYTIEKFIEEAQQFDSKYDS